MDDLSMRMREHTLRKAYFKCHIAGISPNYNFIFGNFDVKCKL